MKGDFFERNFLSFEKQMLLLAADDVNAETMVIRSSRIICNGFVFFFLVFLIQEFSIDCRGRPAVRSRYTGIVMAI